MSSHKRNKQQKEKQDSIDNKKYEQLNNYIESLKETFEIRSFRNSRREIRENKESNTCTFSDVIADLYSILQTPVKISLSDNDR